MSRRLKYTREFISERKFQFEAALLIVFVKFSLRFFPFRVTRKVLASIPVYKYSSPTNRPSLDTLIQSIESGSKRFPGHTTCLVEAMSAQALLKRHGYSSSLQIGLSRPDEHLLHAHAWVEFQGEVLVGDTGDLSVFTQLPSLSDNK